MTPPPPPLSAAVATEEQRLAEAIQAVARSFKAWVGAETRKDGISGPMFWSLHMVAIDGPVTVGHLAEACAVTSANASLVTDDLEREGLIARTRSTEDRRVVTLEATAKGRALAKTIWARVSTRIVDELKGSEPRDIAAAVRVLTKLAESGARPGARA
jgi:MarR family transcriptional regulator, organic hydroperoxide resistance regulator